MKKKSSLIIAFVNVGSRHYYAGINFGGECEWRVSA